MKKKIRIIKDKIEKNKLFFQNFSYLSILQFFNLLIPLLTYPYLIRVLGKDTYGLVIFAQAIVGYFLILVSFGFNISATRDVSVYRSNKSKLSEIVSSVLTIKIILFILSILLLSLLLYIIPQTKGYEILFFLSMVVCINDIIFPIWYFQGIEQMKYITYITLVSKLTFLVLIFIIVKQQTDYLFVPIIYGIGSLLAGLISLTILFKNHKIKFTFQPFVILKKYFTDSIPIFLSNVSISLYVSTNKVIIGTFLGMSEVAYYDLAEKLTTVMKIPQQILGQSLFPKISNEKNIGFVRKIFKISILSHLLLFFIVLSFSKYIIILLGGEQMLPAWIVVNILALTVPIIAMSNIFGIQLLLPFGYNKLFSKVILICGLIYLIQLAIVWLTIGFTLISISIITLTTEIFVTTLMYYYCKKNKLWI